MKASFNPSQAIKAQKINLPSWRDKAMHYRALIVVHPVTKEPRELVKILATPYASGTTARACLWVHGRNALNASFAACDAVPRGHGTAKGYGYDKNAAAIEAALHMAGFTFDGDASADIDGALLAIAELVYATKFVAYGASGCNALFV